jgi:hypothetical protein
MYSPLIKAFNYALDRLSGLDVPGLPECDPKRQPVFVRSATKCIESESYLQGSYKPDIILLKWNTFRRVHNGINDVYSLSYNTEVCCETGSDRSRLCWRNLLSTLEVKRGAPGEAGNRGKQPSKGNTKDKFVNLTYAEGFRDLKDDLEAAKPLKVLQSAPSGMVDEENPIRARKSIPPSSFFTF